jgi:hypothetical protein
MIDQRPALCAEYIRWRTRWPHLIFNPSRKAQSAEWWDRAAAVCDYERCSPALLFWVVKNHRNQNPDDPAVEFQPTLFRSRAIMERSIAAFRKSLQDVFRPLHSLHMIESRNQPYLLPRGLDEACRGIAELSLRFFKWVMAVRCQEIYQIPINEVSTELHDMLAYATCLQNPFLLLSVVKTDKVAALAQHNARWLIFEQPWHETIWSGVAGLPDLRQIHPGEKKLWDGPSHYHWPVSPVSTPYFVLDLNYPDPRLELFDRFSNASVERHLQALDYLAKRG